MFGPPIEGAEAAVRDADVRVIDVPVDDVRDRVVRMLRRANAVCLEAQLEERRVGVEIEKRSQRTEGLRSELKLLRFLRQWHAPNLLRLYDASGRDVAPVGRNLRMQHAGVLACELARCAATAWHNKELRMATHERGVHES